MKTIKLFISEWDERCSWLQTMAEHNIVWSIWATDSDELSYTHLNGEWQFYVKSRELIGAFLTCSPDWAQGHLLLCDKCAVSYCLVAGQLYPSCRFSSADCRCFLVPNCCREIHLASFVHHTALTDRDFKSKSHLSMKYSWFCLIFCRYLGLDSFPR